MPADRTVTGLNAGCLRHRVSLVRDVISRDKGVETRSPQTYATVWASVEFLKGRELWQAQQVSATANAKVVMRYRNDVRASDRLEWNGYRMEIIGEPTPELDQQTSLTIICEAKRV